MAIQGAIVRFIREVAGEKQKEKLAREPAEIGQGSDKCWQYAQKVNNRRVLNKQTAYILRGL